MTLRIEVDEKLSLVKIAGEFFPTVGLVCPMGPADVPGSARWHRTLGGFGGGPQTLAKTNLDCYIPCENGVLVRVADHQDPGGLQVDLNARTCTLSGEGLLLPTTLVARHGRIRPYAVGDGIWWWRDADPEWVVEHINRVGHMGYDEPTGPPVEMIRLEELLDLEDERREHQRA